jgi:hypothetical protein
MIAVTREPYSSARGNHPGTIARSGPASHQYLGGEGQDVRGVQTLRPCLKWARNTAVRRNKAAYDENAYRRDRDRAPVKDGSRRLRS